MPTYNRADFLEKTVGSVLTQQFNDFELIIVDDGSTDHTSTVVSHIVDPRIIYIQKENGERASARNTGIRKARGKYVTFIDSDDLFGPAHLTTAQTRIEQHHPVVFHLGYDVTDEAGNTVVRWQSLPSPVNRKLLDGNYLSCLGVFIRRDIALSCMFNEDRQLSGSEDYELWLRLAARHPISAFPDITARLIHHDDRSVVTVNPEALERRIGLLRKYVTADAEFVREFGSRIRRWNAFLDIYLALHLAMIRNQRARATRFLFHSIARSPRVLFDFRTWVVVKKIVLS